MQNIVVRFIPILHLDTNSDCPKSNDLVGNLYWHFFYDGWMQSLLDHSFMNFCTLHLWRIFILMQVPNVPDANVHTIKVVRRKKLTLERLLFAPVDAASGDSRSGSLASLICGQPANAPSEYDF